MLTGSVEIKLNGKWYFYQELTLYQDPILNSMLTQDTTILGKLKGLPKDLSQVTNFKLTLFNSIEQPTWLNYSEFKKLTSFLRRNDPVFYSDTEINICFNTLFNYNIMYLQDVNEQFVIEGMEDVRFIFWVYK